jgi:hypothetical protein
LAQLEEAPGASQTELSISRFVAQAQDWTLRSIGQVSASFAAWDYLEGDDVV